MGENQIQAYPLFNPKDIGSLRKKTPISTSKYTRLSHTNDYYNCEYCGVLVSIHTLWNKGRHCIVCKNCCAERFKDAGSVFEQEIE